MIIKSEQISNLAAALLKAQTAIGVALKDEKNPYFKSNYAGLKAVIEAVKGPLNNNGIAFLQAVDHENGENGNDRMPVIDTILLHESGQFLSTRTPIFCAKPNDPQAFGSGVTYSKRYALQALLGLPTDDDDAEKAMARNGKKNGKPEAKPKMTSKQIIEQAFFDFTTEHANELAAGFIYDQAKFEKEIVRIFKKKPTVIEAIPQILEKVDPKNCITEMKA